MVGKPKPGIRDVARRKRGPIDGNGKRIVQGAALGRLREELHKPDVLEFIKTCAMYGVSQRSVVAGIKEKFDFKISVDSLQIYLKRDELVRDAYESGRAFMERNLSSTMMAMAIEDRNFSALRWLYATKFGVYERHPQPEEPEVLNAEVQPVETQVSIYIPHNNRDPGELSPGPPADRLSLPPADHVIKASQ